MEGHHPGCTNAVRKLGDTTLPRRGAEPSLFSKTGFGAVRPNERNAANQLAAKRTYPFLPFPSQYSEVNKTVVTERSASVMT